MKGAYLLLVELKKDKKIEIGKLGKIFFKKGYYCYVGSAMGTSMNIKNRTSRHKRLNREKQGKLKWHLDYLLVDADVVIVDLKVFESEKKVECGLSEKMSKVAEGSVKNFGSSDCRCKSHLYYFESKLE